MRIHSLGTEPQISIKSAQKATAGGQGDDFANTLMDVMKEVNQSQNDAANMQNAFMSGRPVEFHDLMIQMEKASTAMQLTMQVRNKLLEGFQEINRMQI